MNDQDKNIVGSQYKNNAIIKADAELLFAGDTYGLFVFKKAERIVAAIYLLTGLMSDKEPMKEKLRSMATELLLTVLEMSERVWGEDTYQKNLINLSCEISVFLDLASKAKMLSKMNHEIMTSELKKFSDFILTSSSNYSSAKIAFEPNLFDGSYNYIPEQRAFPINENISNIQKTEETSTYKGQNEIKDNSKNPHNFSMSDRNQKSEKKILKDKDDRQEIIRAMLNGGLKLTIKDFAKSIKDCSEKTIQRELVDMVSKGVLKKEGERRWSRYFLA